MEVSVQQLTSELTTDPEVSQSSPESPPDDTEWRKQQRRLERDRLRTSAEGFDD